jgi:predicted alpha/beta-hydrolase family hydrolase
MTAGALLLFPGAGSSRTHASLVAIEQAVGPLPVVRADFPYRKAGRSAPDRPPVLLATVREEAESLVSGAHIRANRLVLGGRSMGGRICSMAVADGLPAAGLVLISYPLHPPGKPEQLRVEHLPRLDVPCLFISGTSDAFGTREEIERATARIPGPVEHVWIQGGRHELKGKDSEIAGVVAQWIKGLKKPPRPLG